MAESGDWVTPRLYGKPWFEKPPLLYWGGAIFFKLLGEDHPETAARLPSAISALLATLALAWLAWRTYGQECARWLLLLLPTSVGMIGFSHACATDMPFAGMLTIAMVCAAVVLGLVPQTQDTPILPHTPWPALLLFGFFLGLAVLAKGPAGIILTGGAVFFWALFTKRWRDAFRLLHPAAIAAFCLTALPWYILCARRNPDFFRVFIIEHNFKRYLTPEFQHIQPFWFYLPILLVAFLPWTLVLLTVAFYRTRMWVRRLAADDPSLLFLFSACFCILFFTISKSKLPGYVLPAVPLIAFLASRFTSFDSLEARRYCGGVFLANGLVFTCCAFLVHYKAERLKGLRDLEQGLVMDLLVLIVGYAVSNLLFAFSFLAKPCSRGSLALRFSANVLIIATFALVLSSPEETETATISSKYVSEAIHSRGADNRELRTFGIKRDAQYTLNFYLHHEVPDWNESPVREGYVLTNRSFCSRLDATFSCIDLWAWTDFPGDWALMKISLSDSLPSPSGGRQPQ